MDRTRLASSGAAALPVAVAHFLVYGGPVYFFLSLPIGIIAGLIAFGVALALSYAYLPLRKRLGPLLYFFLHLSGGTAVGVTYAFSTGQVDSVQELLISRHTSYGVFGSLNAWLYLHLSDWSVDKASSYEQIVPVVVGVVLGIATQFLEYPEDDSCHNILRGNRGSISPVLRVRFDLPAEAEERLRGIYNETASLYSLEEKYHAIYTDKQPVSLCNDHIQVSVSGYFDGRHGFMFYEPNPGYDWHRIAHDLVCEFKSNWPNSVSYTGDGGELIAEPDYLSSACAD